MDKKKKNQKFSIEHQYQLFLGRMSLKEHQMPLIQRRMMRETFFGATAQMLILIRDDVSALPEKEAINILSEMLKEVYELFNKDKQN